MSPPIPGVSIIEPIPKSYAHPRSVIETTWDTLEMLVAESMAKLQHVIKNHLADQLRGMSAHSIATNGLEILPDILEGRPAAAPIKLLCFVHVVCSFYLLIYPQSRSQEGRWGRDRDDRDQMERVDRFGEADPRRDLRDDRDPREHKLFRSKMEPRASIAHEQDASQGWTDLFSQALSYISHLTRQDRQPYIQIVEALWKPTNMTEKQVISLGQAKLLQSSSPKDKEPETASASQTSEVSLAFVAKIFLTQFEYLTIQTVDDPELQISSLFMQHVQDVALDTHLPPDEYVNSYISHLWQQTDLLYAQTVPHTVPRTTYYRQGVELMEALISAFQLPKNQQTMQTAPKAPLLDSLDEPIEAMAPNLDAFGFPVEELNAGPQADFHSNNSQSQHPSTSRWRRSNSVEPEKLTNLYLANNQDTGWAKQVAATFQCTKCPKRFTRAYNLRSHLWSHMKQAFVCSVCGKAFARQHDRQSHESLHSGDKKFVCKGDLKAGGQWGCGRRFVRADALGRHLRSEIGYICIKPLVHEEVLEGQRPRQGQQDLLSRLEEVWGASCNR
ncbi:hypothetical protein B0T10DRAFT_568076 [Thelonectria olida]|uniref:C2H2-type domain-containing protein n=1 Tax=Thelonectria olida TaxID=1576542 RepID=A0A9P8VTQ3_9HYPO|nr:hypothetical protein B0T10DRAFT_568076 [Thelonectria olida]